MFRASEFVEGITRMTIDPMALSKDQLEQIVNHISLPDSPVGIDAQYTHAIIITYLQQIADRLERLEERMNGWEEAVD
jgi:uncharacterized protein (UPF0335 family)